MKAFCSFTASVLKITAEVGQKELHTNILLDEFKRIRRKANTPYFVARNDILFSKFPNFIDLIKRKEILNFKKDM